MPAIIRKETQQAVTRAGNPVSVTPSQTSIGALGDGVQDIGAMFDTFQDDIDAADAKAADAEYAELIQRELYDDSTGFMYSKGSDSVSRRQDVADRLEKAGKEILGRLNPNANSHAGSAMRARFNRAVTTVNQHTAAERNTYLNTAATARITTSINDAIFDPSLVAQSITTSRNEIIDMAARQGWPKEKTDLELANAETSIHSGIVQRIATADPSAALAYLRDNKDSMNGADVAKLENTLVPLVREREGRRLGAAAANGTSLPRYDHATRIDFRMGPNRPNKPEKPVLDVIGRAVQDSLGPGARVVVVSGREHEGHQHGSNRHRTGHAADIQILRADGSVVHATDPDAKKIALAAAELGAKGIGWGAEYMGGQHMHIDLVEPGAGQANTWGSAGRAARGEVVGIINARKGGAPTINDILNEPDPDVQAAAISQYNTIMAVKNGQAEAARQAAQDAAFDFIEAGGNIDDIPLEHRQNIGATAMSSLRTYQTKRQAGQPVVTDTETYVQLADLMATNPQAFMEADPMEWRGSLSDSDFQFFVKQRADMKSGLRTAAASAPTVSTLRTAAKTALEAAGIDDKPKVMAQFESDLLRWATEFTAEANEAPSPLEINERINQMLVPITINPVGTSPGVSGVFWDFDKQDARAFEIEYEGDPLNPNDDLTPDDVRDGRLTINGETVSNEIIEMFSQLFNDRMGRAPQVRELVEGLIDEGLYE